MKHHNSRSGCLRMPCWCHLIQKFIITSSAAREPRRLIAKRQNAFNHFSFQQSFQLILSFSKSSWLTWVVVQSHAEQWERLASVETPTADKPHKENHGLKIWREDSRVDPVQSNREPNHEGNSAPRHPMALLFQTINVSFGNRKRI